MIPKRPVCPPRLLLFFDDLHFVDYVAYRNHETGSIFIRTLVATFYKLAGQMDVERLSKTVEILPYTSRNHILYLEYIIDVFFFSIYNAYFFAYLKEQKTIRFFRMFFLNSNYFNYGKYKH